MAIIKLRRGNKANVPAGTAADAGELLFASDTKELLVRDSTGTARPIKVAQADVTLDAGNRFFTDTENTKLAGISTGANKTTASATNGKVKVDGVDLTVYTHPASHASTEVTVSAITGVTVGANVQTALQAIKDYADGLYQGFDYKASVRAATTGNITLSGLQTIDGVILVAGDRVLVKDQTTASQNGIYVVASGAWTRASDADTSAKITAGMYMLVTEGTSNADSAWVLSTNDVITLNTTALTFIQYSGAGQISAGTALSKSGNTINHAAVGTAGTYCKVTTDAQGHVSSGVASLAASDISSGTFPIARGGTNNTAFADGEFIKYDSATAKLMSSGKNAASFADATTFNNHVGSGGASHANAVAGGAAGFMTGADKTKLDGIVSFANMGYVGVTGTTGSTINGSKTGKLQFSGTEGVVINVDEDVNGALIGITISTIDGGTF